MRIDAAQLLREPIGTQASSEVDLGFQRLSDDLSVSAIKGQLKLLRTSEGIQTRGVLSVDVDLECGRCLSPVTETIKVELEERFLASLLNVSEDEQVFPIDADHHLDLTPVLGDLVVVSTPMHVLCRPGCLGLCCTCGKNLNEGLCDCQPDEIDPRLAALKALIK